MPSKNIFLLSISKFHKKIKFTFSPKYIIIEKHIVIMYMNFKKRKIDG